MAVKEQSQADATLGGTEVEIIDEEEHRSKQMREVRYLEGEHEGATAWTFVEELEGI